MRIETITRELYKFDELTEENQVKALLNLYDINVDHSWRESTYEDAEQIGLNITSFDLDRKSYVEGEFILSACEVAQNIFNNHGNHCETYKTAESFMLEWQPVFDDYMDEKSEHYESAEQEDKLLALESEFLKSLQEDYRIILQKDYDYLVSDEAAKETIEANDYEFNVDGKLA